MGLISRVSSRTYRFHFKMLRRSLQYLQKIPKPPVNSVKETAKTHQPGEGFAHMAKDTNTVFRATSLELFVKPNMKIAVPGTILFLGCVGFIGYMRYNADAAVQAGTHKYGYNEDGEKRMLVNKGSRWD